MKGSNFFSVTHAIDNAARRFNNGPTFKNVSPEAVLDILTLHKGNKIQEFQVRTGDFLYKRARKTEMMSHIETGAPLHHTDRGNNFRNITGAGEALPSFNTHIILKPCSPELLFLKKKFLKHTCYIKTKFTLWNYTNTYKYVYTTDTNCESVTAMNFLLTV